MTAGDPPDLDALLLHADWLSALSRQLCRDQHAAADAAQDTLLMAMQKPPQHAGNLRGFLATVLRNTLRLRARAGERAQRRERSVAREGWSEAAAEAAARAELQQFLGRCVLELPEPQRGLVLWHYFEGLEVAALAARAGMSGDAVRAHLRRARETLRARLVRSEGEARRGFGLLLAAEGGRSLIKVGALMALTMKAKVALATAGAAAAAFLFWQLAAPSSEPLANASPIAASPATGLISPVADHAVPPETAQRTEVAVAEPLRRVPCKLVGLHPDARWTATVKVELEGKDAATPHHDELQAKPAADGAFALPMPAWTSTCSTFALRLRAEDPLYLDVDVQTDSTSLTAAVYEIPVQVVAVFTGKVIDSRGEPVPAARVAAYAMRDALPIDAVLAATNTAADGTFTLQAPVQADVLLVAVAMHEMQLSGLRITGRNGSIADNGAHRDLLLPAACTARAVAGQRTAVREFVLGAPALVEGTVFRPGRQPFPTSVWAPAVNLLYAGDARLHFDNTEPPLVWWRDGAIALESSSQSRGGRFQLPGHPGRVARLVLGKQPEYPAIAPIEREVVPPCHIDLELPGRELHVLVRLDGRPAPGVTLLHSSKMERGLDRTDEHGEARFHVPPGVDYFVQAMADGCANQEVSFAAAATLPEPAVIDLRRLPMVPVTLELVGEVRVRTARISWQPIDGTPGGYLPIALHRADQGPIRTEVPPGRYRLTIGAREHGERNDTFLRAMTQEVDVPAAGAALSFATTHGGRIAVDVHDAQGLRAAGSVRFIDARGTVLVPGIRGSDSTPANAGKLLASGISECVENLAPGRCEVILDLGAHGIVKRTIEVKACEVTEVKVDLK